MTYKDWHISQKDPNIHLYRILAANWLKDLHEISQSFLLLLGQLTEGITYSGTYLEHPMLLLNTFWSSNLTKKTHAYQHPFFVWSFPLLKYNTFY